MEIGDIDFSPEKYLEDLEKRGEAKSIPPEKFEASRARIDKAMKEFSLEANIAHNRAIQRAAQIYLTD